MPTKIDLLRRNPLTDGVVGDSSVDGVRAVEVHPLVLLGAVDADTVLLGAGVPGGLPLHPVGVGEGLPAGVDVDTFSVQIVGSDPVGGQATTDSIG